MTTPPTGPPDQPPENPGGPPHEPGGPHNWPPQEPSGPFNWPPPQQPPQQPPAGGPPNQPPQPPGWQPPGWGQRPPPDPIVATDFEEWFGRMFGVAKRSFGWLVALNTIVAIPTGFYVYYFARLGLRLRSAQDSNGKIEHLPHVADVLGPAAVAICIAVLVGVIVQPMSLWIAVSQAAGRRVDPAVALRFAVRRALPLLGWQLVAGLMVAVGFVLLAVPGIYLLVVVLPTIAPVVVIERGGIGRCFALIRRRWWATLGRVVVFALILLAYSELGQLIAQLIAGSDPTAKVGGAVLITIFTLPIAAASIGFLLATYAELRGRKEPVTTPQLVAELER